MNARQGNRPRPLNKSSSLLTKEENELVFSILGKKCVSLATAVVQVFMTEPPNHLSWIKQYCGAVCLVKDNPRHSYFIRVVDINKRAAVWDQELYDQFEYKVPLPFFHTFESDSCQTGLNFADDNEANYFRLAVQTKLRQWQQRQEKRRAQQTAPTSKGIPGQISGRRAESLPSLNNADQKKKKKKQKLSKADIGLPTDFIHIQHVGWDRKDLDFDISQSEELDPTLRNFFKIAGVSERDLADQSTRNFIYDFIDKNGGLNVIRGASKPAGQPPPVPARDSSASHRHPTSATSVRPPVPAPPPVRNAVPPPVPPPPNRATGAPPPLPTSNKPAVVLSTNATSMPPQIPPTSVRLPPPPPPPLAPPSCPPPALAQIPPPPPPPPPPPLDTAGAMDARAALLEGIRKGISLNPVEADVDTNRMPVSPSDDREKLLHQIRQGIELRPVSDELKNAPSSGPPIEGLAGALAKALEERARAIHLTDESDSDEDELDDDDWDD